MTRRRTHRSRLAAAAGVVAAALALVAGPLWLTPAHADLDPPSGSLVCDANSPSWPPDDVYALGSADQGALQQNLFIPAHESRCPATAGTVHYMDAPETVAVSALEHRTVPNLPEQQIPLFIGVNQPLSSSEWALSTISTRPIPDTAHTTLMWQLPVMMDGFVVTANIHCGDGSAPGVLKLTPLTLSLIYTGYTHNWGTAELLADNPWMDECFRVGDPTIRTSVRTDAAWSTAALKDYLSTANPVFDYYKQREQATSWPQPLVISCAGATEAAMVSCATLPGAISYMRYSTAKANGLTPVLLTNGNGDTPPPALDPADTWPSGCTAAVPTGSVTSPQTLTPAGLALDWGTFSMARGGGYPLCGMSFAVAPQGQVGATSYAFANRKDHFKLMWSDTLQESLKSYGYAPIPAALLSNVRAALDIME